MTCAHRHTQMGLYCVLFNSLECPVSSLPPLNPSQAEDTHAANLRKGHGPSQTRRMFKHPVLGKVCVCVLSECV